MCVEEEQLSTNKKIVVMRRNTKCGALFVCLFCVCVCVCVCVHFPNFYFFKRREQRREHK
jgi:hypothetical protein